MPNPATNSGIRHNHRRGVCADFLKARIHFGSRLSVVSVYFTIYAYEALLEHLDHIDHLDFLFGEGAIRTCRTGACLAPPLYGSLAPSM
jgi:hypothetical protein